MRQPWKALYIQNLLQELIDSQFPLTAVLERCDEAFVSRLRATAHDIASATSTEKTYEELDNLRKTAHQSMKTCGDVSLVAAWMQMYTNSTLLLALGHLTAFTALESIALLDHIIIVCGTACGRLESIQALISDIQRSFLSYEPSRSYSTHFTELSPLQPDPPDQPAAQAKVLVLPGAPSLFKFQSTLATCPFVLRSFADDWPALTHHPWCSAAYLKAVSGPGRVVPIEVGKDYREDDWHQEVMSWDAFLTSLDLRDQASEMRNPPQNTLYLAQYNLLSQFPSLRDDIDVPDYAYASINADDFTGYEPPRNEDKLVINAWLGPQGTHSPAHTDPYFNTFVQVVGYKTVWLAPPEISASISATKCEAAHPSLSLLSNTTSFDVFCTDSNGNNRVPEDVIAKASYTTLGPGDMLFIPPGWWHAMRSDSTSFSVSMWF